MAGKFVLKKTGKGKFVFNLRAANGLVILTSEAYRNKGSALKGIESVRKHAVKDANFERRTTKNGQAYFVLKSTNKQIIGQSETYASPSSVGKGIASVQAHSQTARIEDLTE